MVKTKGAIDLKGHRKKRKDRGHKRKFYAGKKVKRKRKNRGGNFVPYESKRRDRNAPVLIWFWSKEKMSPEGYRRFPSRMRQWIKPIILRFVDKPFYANTFDIENKEKLGALAVDKIQFPGSFNLMMPSHSKNSFRVSFKKKAEIKILEDGEGNLYARVMNCGALRRYWFFHD